ncbi:MAG TPA: formyltetrahydrofolate deformylase [Candidatus Acidoferrales bacterium]|nr:formyltetrahydrofolate deformylase [Candidatus Acidoferrales bacterium]
MSAATASLFVSGPDRRGLVAQIAGFIYEHNGNILHSDHHIDAESGLFLNRIEWDLASFRIPRAEIAVRFAPLAESLGMHWGLHFSDERQRIAIFVSKYDHCLYDLLLRGAAGELRGEVALVISNHPNLEPLARQFGVPYRVFPITPETKQAQEAKELALLAEHSIDLIVLARYLQVFTADFVSRYPNRMINIHDSFLPAFVGARPYHRAYERGVKLIGATSHYVTDTLDDGPIIEQDVVRVSHRDTVEDLLRKGRDLERIVLARAVRLHLEHRVLPYGRKTVVFD